MSNCASVPSVFRLGTPAGVARSPTDGPQRRLTWPVTRRTSSLGDDVRRFRGAGCGVGNRTRVSTAQGDDVGGEASASACVRPVCCPVGIAGIHTAHESAWDGHEGRARVASAPVCCPVGNAGRGTGARGQRRPRDRGARAPPTQGRAARGHRRPRDEQREGTPSRVGRLPPARPPLPAPAESSVPGAGALRPRRAPTPRPARARAGSAAPCRPSRSCRGSGR
jgi:hypothetical protein